MIDEEKQSKDIFEWLLRRLMNENPERMIEIILDICEDFKKIYEENEKLKMKLDREGKY